MRLDLTEEEVRALLRELDNVIENDRYPLSPRIRLRAAFGRTFPMRHRSRRRRARRRPKNVRRGERHALVGRGVRWGVAALFRGSFRRDP